MKPTKESLKALSGWALVHRDDVCDRTKLAMEKLGDAAAELADCPLPESVLSEGVPTLEGGNYQPKGPVIKVPAVRRRITNMKPRVCRIPASSVSSLTPEEVQDAIALADQYHGREPQVPCTEGGEHRFDIHTQRCEGCGETFLKIKGRKPDLMGW